jgi:hypothetical protein
VTSLERELLEALKVCASKLAECSPDVAQSAARASIMDAVAKAEAEAKDSPLGPWGCQCKDGWAQHTPDEVCGAFVAGTMKAEWCETCGHDEACHNTSPTQPMLSEIRRAYD